LTPPELSDPWVAVDVSDWELVGIEQSGTNTPVWLRDPDDLVWLHKSTRIPSSGVEEGQDWGEVAATQTADLLGVPSARTRLCVKDGRRGSLSLQMRPVAHDLIQAWVFLLSAGVPGFVPHAGRGEPVDPTRPGVRRPGHSLENIRSALNGVAAPPEFSGPGGLSGFDVFAGYAVFDALVANRDRHDDNWAVLRPQMVGIPDRLAPSYDHGGSLGSNLTDDERDRLLSIPTSLAAWVGKGTAHRFEHTGRPPSLVEHAAKAVSMASPEAAQWWRARLASLDLSPISRVLTQGVPGMSVPAATFANKVLDLNLRRLQDAICIGS
jgi:hypothetical protein